MTSAELDQRWVLEFSKSQKTFSIRTLLNSVEDNLYTFLEGKTCDFSIIAVGDSHEEMTALCQSLDRGLDRGNPFTLEEASVLWPAIRERLGMRGMPPLAH